MSIPDVWSHPDFRSQDSVEGLPDDANRRPGWVGRLAPPLLFVVAVAVRALPAAGVFLIGGVQYFGNDAYYHMRRALYSLEHFPSVLSFDRYVNFPIGAQPIWTPFFDWFLALVLLPLRGGPLDRIEVAAVWIPPVLGGVTVLVLYGLARRRFGETVAVLAGSTLALMSAHFWYSQLGFIDHHVAVALVTTILLATAMTFVERATGQPGPPGRLARSAAACGLTIAAALLVWPGALLHVGLVEIGLLVCLLTRGTSDAAVRLGLALGILHGTAFILTAPFGIGATWARWNDFSPVVLSNFQPWFFGAATAFSLVCAGVWRRLPGAASTGPARFGSAAGIGVGLLLVSLVAWPSLLEGALDPWTWFSRDESFQAMVAESAPMLIDKDAFSTRMLFRRLSVFSLIAPFALLAGAVSAVRRGLWGPGLFVWWTTALLLATLAQRRFFNSASVALALLFALTLVWMFRIIASRQSWSATRRSLARAAISVLALAMLTPMLSSYRFYAPALFAHLFNEKAFPSSDRGLVYKFEARELGRWLERFTPETSGWVHDDGVPEYGVLASWGIGHILKYVSHRPTVTDNFGDDIGAEGFHAAQRYFHVDEAEASEILDRLRVRYVVINSNSSFLAETPGFETLYASLIRFDGAQFVPRRGSDQPPLPASRRHRLLYESRLTRGPRRVPPKFKLFEYVRGARIEGRAAPGIEVKLVLPMITNRGRHTRYWASSKADADGLYTFTVPYSNDVEFSAVRPRRAYTVRCGSEENTLVVTEAAVQEGLVVVGPDICL